MASSYSTDLKLELMVTGENAGTWGDKTNDNLDLIQQAIVGYESIAVNATTGTTLVMSNSPTLSNARNAVLNLTGTLAGNVNVTVPNSIEKTYGLMLFQYEIIYYYLYAFKSENIHFSSFFRKRLKHYKKGHLIKKSKKS